MKLQIEPEDAVGFSTARNVVLERLERWLREDRGLSHQDAMDVSADAGVALEWKWSCGDGDLGSWPAEDIAAFLFEWCPRKLSVAPADSATIPAAVGHLLEFLEEGAMLAAGSYAPARLADAIEVMTDEFVKAMGDTSKFGLAKTLFGAASDEGVDLCDPDQLDKWMAEFNARPEDERRRLVPDRALGAHRVPERPRFPPVALPSEDEVAASIAGAPIVAKFVQLAAFVGDGRRLTQKGNLALADARVLVELLDTGDVMDETIGGRTFKTRSSADLWRLDQMFSWAKRAGVIRVRQGKVLATKRGLALVDHPAREFDRVVDALFDLGPLSLQRDPEGWFAWPEVDRLLDEATVALLSGPYASQRPVPLEDIAGAAADAVLSAFEFGSLSDEHVAARVTTDVIEIVDVLEIAGLVVRAGAEAPERGGRGRRREGGTVELTPAGVASTRRLLVARGYEAPIAGRFVDATAAELLVGTDLEDFPTLWGELEAWRRRRGPEEAAAGLAAAVRELDDPALCNLALAAMSEIDPDVAVPYVRELATEPASRGFALCWLVDHDLEGRQALFDPGDLETFLDVLTHRLVTMGVDELVETLSLAGSHGQQVKVIDGIWRAPSTATEPVLVAIGEVHPVKAVAKAARRAAFKRRSWLASR